jgi:GNAT superfamily N-acetyltransferase
MHVDSLPGQETLVACWRALAQISPDARIVHTSLATAAVFPAWPPLNNAIALDDSNGVAAASELSGVYADAGVDAWALWMPSRAVSLDAPDGVRTVGDLRRDTTTLVMRATLTNGLRLHGNVVPASIDAIAHLEDEPIPVSELGEPEVVPGLAGWAIAVGDVAVAGGWSFIHGRDCGIYAVGTVPAFRRRGLARSLVEHMLADAASRGARTSSLQSTRMGRHLYLSLGFTPAGRYEEWTPQ